MGSIHQNGDRLREPKVWGHSQTRGWAGVTELSGSTVSAAWGPVLILSTIIFYCRSLCQWSLGMDTNCAPSSCGRRGLKNRQKPLRIIFLPSLACRDRSQIVDLDRGLGIVLVHALWTPRTFFLLLLRQPFYISRVSLFFLLLYSSVAQTLKNVGPLDYILLLLRQRSLGGKILVVEVMHLLTLNVFSANFRVVLVVAAFFIFSFFFIHFLPNTFFFPFFSLWWLRTFFFLSRNSLGVHLDWDGICEVGAMLLFFMLLKSAILCDLYVLTYIICAIETPCDANLFLPLIFVSIHFSIAGAIFKRRICDWKNLNNHWGWCECR